MKTWINNLSDTHLEGWLKMTRTTLDNSEARYNETPQDAWRKAAWEEDLDTHYRFINEAFRRAQ